MNVKNFLISGLCLAFFIGCSTNSPKISKKDSEIYGTYQATLPCASCEGIEQVLTLKDNGSYVLQSTYLGEKDGKFIEKGIYNIEKQTITTTNQYKEKNYYTVKGSNLILLDSEKREATGPLKDLYIFKPYKK